MSLRSDKQPVGAPLGSQNGLSHGVVAFKNEVKRRARHGRSLIDHRTVSGQNAVAAQAGIADDLGGVDHLSTAQKVLIELVGRDLYLLDETDQRIIRACKEIPRLKNSPKGMATLYSYRVPIVSNLTRNLTALGLEKKPPPTKTLEQILNEDEQE
jgi:hypothetical protein